MALTVKASVIGVLCLLVSLVSGLSANADDPVKTCPACGEASDNWQYEGMTDCRSLGAGLLPYWTCPNCGSTRTFGMIGGAPISAAGGGGYMTMTFQERYAKWGW